MYAGSKTSALTLAFTLAAATTPVTASPITIGGFEFDLAQFDDAYVTVSQGVTENDVHASHFDNNFGIDPNVGNEPNGYELGELAGRNRGDGKHGAFVADNGDERDVGDRITLDGLYTDTDGAEKAKALTLHYGDQAALLDDYSEFIVYEQSSHPSNGGFIQEVDDEGKNFQIRFTFENNASTGWFAADPASYNENPPVTVSRVFDPDNPGSTQNQVVFSLSALNLGGSLISSVGISNLLDAPDGVNDPDFLFAGFATQDGGITSVPLPSSMILLLSGLVFGGLFGAWRCGLWSMPALLRAAR